MERKLASIQLIVSLSPIENADRIEKATVLGWDVVIKKGEFVVGSKCIFCEIDSILPAGPEWSEFMRERHFRVKTAKLRGVLSQGLAFPCSILPGSELFDVDTEVTEQLGIVKYEPQLHDGGMHLGMAAGGFPTRLVPKTDEIRLQSKLRLIEELKTAGEWVATVKVDGMSSTFCYDGDEFICASRNYKKKDDEKNFFWKIARKYKIAEILSEHKNLAIQGEIAGPSIQGNKLNLSDQELFVFDVYDMDARRYFDYAEFVQFCNEHQLMRVPFAAMNDGRFVSKEFFLGLAEGKYDGTLQEREGIVVRPMKTTYSPTLQGRLSFKVISNRFLLKTGE